MEFEFNKQLIAQDMIDIPQIGSFAIEAEGAMGDLYYLVILTSLGTSTIATCGPVVPDVELLPNGFSTNLTRMEYNEKRLIKTINLFLNDREKQIYKAKLIDIDKALDEFRDLGFYMKNYSKGNY